MITQAMLKAVAIYDPNTGLFTRRVNASKAKAGTVMNHSRKDGYQTISLFGEKQLAHRMAWLYVHGTYPTNDLDHIDGNPTNNSFSNLREATRTENLQNMRHPRKNRSSPVNGVKWSKKRGKYCVQVVVDRKSYWGGYHESLDDAIEVLLELKEKHHPFRPPALVA